MMLVGPGKKPFSLPILSSALPEEEPVATFVEPHALTTYQPQNGFPNQPPEWCPGVPSELTHLPMPAKVEAFNEFEQPMYFDSAAYYGLGDTISLGPAAATLLAAEQAPLETVPVQEQHDMMRQRLLEKREMLDASLMRYKHVSSQLSCSPGNHLLQQCHEEAEIEAAGYQAEVAVLSQHLNELDETLRARGDPPTLPSAMNLAYDGHVQLDAMNAHCADNLSYNSHL